MSATADLGTFNCLFRNEPDVVKADVLAVASQASVLVLTEARSTGVDDALAELGWRQFRHPRESSDRIVWDPALWAALDVFGDDRVHGPGPGKYLPARDITWQGLRHRPTSTRHLVMASHVTAGYAGDAGHQAWRDHAAQLHLLGIVARTARLQQRDDLDYFHLAGDLNAHRVRTQEWWYPVRILGSLYMPDDSEGVGGLDYVMHTRLSEDRGMRETRRWTTTDGLHSDHPAHFKRVRFPRDERKV